MVIRTAKGDKRCNVGRAMEKRRIEKGDRLALVNENAVSRYVQSEPSAYWPDGSIKWTKHAAVFSGQANQSFTVQKEKPRDQPNRSASMSQSITSKSIQECSSVPSIKQAPTSFNHCRLTESRSPQAEARCLKRNEKRDGGGNGSFHETSVSLIKRAAIEKSGPIKALVKIEGVHILQKQMRRGAVCHPIDVLCRTV